MYFVLAASVTALHTIITYLRSVRFRAESALCLDLKRVLRSQEAEGYRINSCVAIGATQLSALSATDHEAPVGALGTEIFAAEVLVAGRSSGPCCSEF